MRGDTSAAGVVGFRRAVNHGRDHAAGWVIAALVIVLCGCSPGQGSAQPESEAPSSAGAPALKACPNPDGYRCLGELQPAWEYTTVSFTPAITYSVPDDGWFNQEDTPGNFLLVPPGQPLEGVDGGTADFIGVYTSVVVPEFTDPDGCEVQPVTDVDPTPEAMTAWMADQTSLAVTDPTRVTVGGLSGLVIDVRARAGTTLPTCTDATEEVSVGLLILGQTPSSLVHGVIPDMTMRLYLLDHDDGTLAIEISDIDAAPATMDELADIAEAFVFTP